MASCLLLAAALTSRPVRAVVAEEGDEFKVLFDRAREALRRSDLDSARTLCRQAFERSGDPPSGGAKSALAMDLCGEIAMKGKRFKWARSAFKRAAGFSVNDRAFRRRMLEKRQAAAWARKLSDDIVRVRALVRHDAAIDALLRQRSIPERRKDEIRSSIEGAISMYREDGDPSSENLALAVRALVSARAGAHEQALAEAVPLLGAPDTTRRSRLVALEAVWASGAALGHLEVAARAALELNALRHEHLPEAKRRYLRTRGLDGLCAQYDEQQKPGGCARLEREVTGAYTFTDFSALRPRRALSDGDVERVHAQFLPAIEECLRDAARKNVETYFGSEIRVGWAIQPRGRASDVEIAPKRYREDLGPCITERVGWLRYPRYVSSERKTVTIPFHLGDEHDTP